MKAEMAASWAFRSRGLVGSILAVACGALAAVSLPLAPAGAWYRVELDVIGWLVFIAGLGLRFWATLYIGGRKAVTLVHEGPYSLCRNPLYLGTLLVALSAAIMLQSLALAAGMLVGAVFYALATVPAEERFLRKKLGEPYVRYCQRVPRFWPHLAGFHTSRAITVNIKGLRLECRRAARWIWLPIFIELAEHLRCEAWWP